MNEIEPIVHQDDHCSDNEHEVLLGDGDQVMHKATHGRPDHRHEAAHQDAYGWRQWPQHHVR